MPVFTVQGDMRCLMYVIHMSAPPPLAVWSLECQQYRHVKPGEHLKPLLRRNVQGPESAVFGLARSNDGESGVLGPTPDCRQLYGHGRWRAGEFMGSYIR